MSLTLDENALSRHIIDAAVEVQRVLGGPGLLEHIYEEALADELTRRGFDVRQQVVLPVMYKGKPLRTRLRLDLIVNDKVVVEVKAVSKLIEAFGAQALSYIRCSDKRLALIINFGQRPIRQGIQRVVNDLPE
jgi:GxxExxY protein